MEQKWWWCAGCRTLRPPADAAGGCSQCTEKAKDPSEPSAQQSVVEPLLRRLAANSVPTLVEVREIVARLKQLGALVSTISLTCAIKALGRCGDPVGAVALLNEVGARPPAIYVVLAALSPRCVVSLYRLHPLGVGA